MYTPPMKRLSIEPAIIIAPRRTVSLNPPSGNCYNCSKEGHWAKDCPIPKKEGIRKIATDSKDSISSKDKLKASGNKMNRSEVSEN